MARTAYDVNRAVRHLDIHKQFMGGLKTVDTDDALRTVYMRELKNLSLSEYGFIEKRYGIYKQELFEFVDGSGNAINPLATGDEFIQGYFEYYDKEKNLHKLIFIDGIPYIKDPRPESAYPTKFRKTTAYIQEEDEVYPLASEVVLKTDLSILNYTLSTGLNVLVDFDLKFADLADTELELEVGATISQNIIQSVDLDTPLELISGVSHTVLIETQIFENFNLATSVDINFNAIQSVDLDVALNFEVLANILDSSFAFENEQYTTALNPVLANINFSIVPSEVVTEVFNLISAASINETISKFDCPPSGQLLSTYCSGTTKYGVYTNGSCGTYNQVIETNSTDCGYTPPPPPPDPFVVRAKSNVGNPVVQITTPNEQFQDALTQTYQVIDNAIDGSSTYSITVNAPQTITIGSDTYTFESWTLNGTSYGGTSRTFSGLNSDSDLEARYLFTPPPPSGGGGNPPLQQLP